MSQAGTSGTGTIEPTEITLDGDVSFATGAEITIHTGVAVNNSGSSIEFVGNGVSTLTLNVTDTDENTIIGKGSGNLTLTGTDNVALGFQAMVALTSGDMNLALGNHTLADNTTGSNNIAIGDNALNSLNGDNGNVAIGYQSIQAITTGGGNVAVGTGTIASATDTNSNTAIGAAALNSLLTGDQNTAVGAISGNGITTGTNNLYLGYSAGSSNTAAESSNIYLQSTGVVSESHTLRIGADTGTGTRELNQAFICGINGVTSSNPMMVTINSATDQLGTAAVPSSGVVTINGDTGTATGDPITLTALDGANNSGASVQFTASGSKVVLDVTDPSDNTFVGKDSGNSTLTGTDNVALGNNILPVLTTGTFNIGVGNNSLLLNSTGSLNIAIGHSSLAANTTQNDNIAVGYQSLMALNGGAANIAIGNAALLVSTTDNANIAIGSSCLDSLNGGSNNTIIGRIGMATSTADSQNVGLGNNVLHDLDGGDNNVAVGYNAGDNVETGSENIYIGFAAGTTNTTSESANIYLNSVGVIADSHTLRIGAATGSGTQELNKSFISGIVGNTVSNTKLVTIDSSTDQLGVIDVPGVDGIQTIDGDSGSASGATVSLKALDGALHSGASVSFTGSGSALVLNVTDATDNTIIGENSGDVATTGTNNVSVGKDCFLALTTGSYNIGLGNGSFGALLTGSTNVSIGGLGLALCESGSQNIAIGNQALAQTVSDSQNIAIGDAVMFQLEGSSTATGNIGIGSQCLLNTAADSRNITMGIAGLHDLNGGSDNLAFGNSAASSLTTGSFNIMLGTAVGSAYTTSESSNILLNTAGVIADSNTLRIGLATGSGNAQLNKAFICGINGNTVSNTKMVTINSSTDQLGIADVPFGTIVWTDQGISFTAAVQNGYFCTAALTVTLPASPVQGDQVNIAVDTTGSVVVQANTGQIIRVGAGVSSTAGTATNIVRGDSLQLVFRAANNQWQSIATEGSWNLA